MISRLQAEDTLRFATAVRAAVHADKNHWRAYVARLSGLAQGRKPKILGSSEFDAVRAARGRV